MNYGLSVPWSCEWQYGQANSGGVNPREHTFGIQCQTQKQVTEGHMQNSAIHLKLNNIQNTKGNDKPQTDAGGGGDTGKGLQRSIWGGSNHIF